MGTMLAMPALQIELFEQMTALSARMVEAAHAQDWDCLLELEQSVAALRKRLTAPDMNVTLSADEVEMKRALIQRILDDDAEIRRHTEPWMEHVRQFLGNTVRQRRVNEAYGVGIGPFDHPAG